MDCYRNVFVGFYYLTETKIPRYRAQLYIKYHRNGACICAEYILKTVYVAAVFCFSIFICAVQVNLTFRKVPEPANRTPAENLNSCLLSQPTSELINEVYTTQIRRLGRRLISSAGENVFSYLRRWLERNVLRKKRRG